MWLQFFSFSLFCCCPSPSNTSTADRQPFVNKRSSDGTQLPLSQLAVISSPSLCTLSTRNGTFLHHSANETLPSRSSVRVKILLVKMLELPNLTVSISRCARSCASRAKSPLLVAVSRGRQRHQIHRFHAERETTMRQSKHSRVFPSLAVLLLLFLLSFVLCSGASSEPQPQVRCSRSCVAENCNALGIKYGKYCGVGWSGCPGEKPCDDLDACCKIHDDCVEKKGMTSIWCHEKFKRCIQKVKKSGKQGFSKECPYEVVMPTMIQGMDMAILFSQLGSDRAEL